MMPNHSPIFICGGEMSPVSREEECPNTLHDWPLPAGYVDAHESARSRLSRQWVNRKCPDCGIYGWVPGRLGEHDKEVVRRA